MRKRTFTGFGFGPIQSGLFLLEAQASGNFGRYVVAEIDAELVKAVRRNDHRCTVNVALDDGIIHHELGGIELYNPNVPEDREALVEAVAESAEMATALPSVDAYPAGGGNSVLAILADGLRQKHQDSTAIIYTAENNNRAAEILTRGLMEKLGGDVPAGFQALDTVLGKMSGIISGGQLVERLGLRPLVPGMDRAVLVEEFNRILVSRVCLEGFERGIRAFEEKEDLDPFEEAKLYGHNAVHALMGYLAALRGYTTIAEVRHDTQLMEAARRAFHDECGTALVSKHGGIGDRLFTKEGFAEFADDLLHRMVCPYLHDLVERVARDPARKLAWADRLYGAMRLAMAEGVETPLLAGGAAAGLIHLFRSPEDREKVGLEPPGHDEPVPPAEETIRKVLHRIWQPANPPRDEAEALVARTMHGMEWLRSEGWLGKAAGR